MTAIAPPVRDGGVAVNVYHGVNLTGDELELLASIDRAEVRSVIEKARYFRSLEIELGITPRQAWMLGLVLEASQAEKRVYAVKRAAEQCPLCQRQGDVYVPKRRRRNSRRSSERLPIAVWQLVYRFIAIDRHVSEGWCEHCHDGGMREALLRATASVALEVPQHLTGVAPRFKAFERVRCQKPECGWEGHEGEMPTAWALIGDGRVPDACPKCGDRRQIFVPTTGPVGFNPRQWVAVPIAERAA